LEKKEKYTYSLKRKKKDPRLTQGGGGHIISGDLPGAQKLFQRNPRNKPRRISTTSDTHDHGKEPGGNPEAVKQRHSSEKLLTEKKLGLEEVTTMEMVPIEEDNSKVEKSRHCQVNHESYLAHVQMHGVNFGKLTGRKKMKK